MAAKSRTNQIADRLRHVAVIHFFLLGAYGLQTIVMDAWHIIVPSVVLRRWIATASIAVVVAAVWYLVHNPRNSLATIKRLTFTLITADAVFAAYNVYIQRGMASKSVMLFAIPIATAAVLMSRSAVITAAILSTAAYIISAVSYFTFNFNEGYKTELYSELGLYTAIFIALAFIIAVSIRNKD